MLHASSHTVGAVLDTRPHGAQRFSDRFAGRTRGAGQGVANPAACRTHNIAGSASYAADQVAHGARRKLGRARYALVLAVCLDGHVDSLVCVCRGAED
jgi:hypothetical protein